MYEDVSSVAAILYRSIIFNYTFRYFLPLISHILTLTPLSTYLLGRIILDAFFTTLRRIEYKTPYILTLILGCLFILGHLLNHYYVLKEGDSLAQTPDVTIYFCGHHTHYIECSHIRDRTDLLVRLCNKAINSLMQSPNSSCISPRNLTINSFANTCLLGSLAGRISFP